MEQLHHIIYQSQLIDSSTEAIEAILQTARHTNPRRHITGMMLCANGDVLQVLEGDKGAVEKLFGQIAKDPRHRNVFVVINEPISARHFPNWSMGYRGIGPQDSETFKRYQEAFCAFTEPTKGRMRQGLASEVVEAFCDWAMR